MSSLVVKNDFSCNGVTKKKGDVMFAEDMDVIGEKLFAELVVNNCFESSEEDKAKAKVVLEAMIEKENQAKEQKLKQAASHSLVKNEQPKPPPKPVEQPKAVEPEPIEELEADDEVDEEEGSKKKSTRKSKK